LTLGVVGADRSTKSCVLHESSGGVLGLELVDPQDGVDEGGEIDDVVDENVDLETKLGLLQFLCILAASDVLEEIFDVLLAREDFVALGGLSIVRVGEFGRGLLVGNTVLERGEHGVDVAKV
jgi:hypothetical protein